MAAEPYRSATQADPKAPRPSGRGLVLDHVQVAAPPGCEGAARRFYGELLGLEELDRPAPLGDRGGAWFALGGGAQVHVGVVRDGFAPAAKAHPAFRAASFDALRALAQRCTDAGAPVSWDTTLPRVPRFFTADPWGNRVELLA